ncbi:hypothetical protein Efla_001124 [Eimeria flavescens]
MKAADERKRLLSKPGANLPRGAVLAIKVTPAELQGISRKLAPSLTRWIAPDERRSNNLYSTRVDDQSHAMSPEKNLTVTEPREHEQSCRQAPTLPDEVVETALGEEPLPEGLPWTLSQRARAAAGAAFVRARIPEDVDREQEANDMVQRSELRHNR